MIASSALAKGGALICALALHGVLAWALIEPPTARIESGAGASSAVLGTSFADMAAGTLTATGAEDVTAPVTPAEAEAEPLQPATPEAAPLAPVAAETPPPPEDRLAALEPLRPEAALPVLPEAITSTAQTPEAAEPIAPEETPEAVTRSLRPVQRSEAFEARNAPPPRPEASKPRAPEPVRAPRGNAEIGATAGAATGRAEAEDTRQGISAGRATEAGNAAASNYPGLVMKKIARVRKPAMNRRGTTRVAFSIAPSGALARIGVAQSAGSADLDREAVRLIQRAAPFPPPPAGARLDFSIDVEFR